MQQLNLSMSQINRLHQSYELQYMLLEETTYCNCKVGDCSGSSDRLKKFHQHCVLRLTPLSNIKNILHSRSTDNKYMQIT